MVIMRGVKCPVQVNRSMRMWSMRPGHVMIAEYRAR